jgi:hypothetical protein
MTPPKKKLSKLAQHAKDVHAYPYDDLEDLSRPLLEGWHRARHADEAEAEHSKMKEA